MLVKKYWHTLCRGEYHIYTVGGYDNSSRLGDCERYSIFKDVWHQLPKLNIPRNRCAVFTFKKSLYALGGYNGQSLNTMEQLDIENMSLWIIVEVKNPIKEACELHAIQISKRNVLVFGGSHGAECYLLSMEAIVCKKLHSLNGNFCSTAAPVFDQKNVYAVTEEHKLCIYDVKEDTWKQVS